MGDTTVKLIKTEQHNYLILAPRYKPLKLWRHRKVSEREYNARIVHRMRWDHFGLVGRLRYGMSVMYSIKASPSTTLRAKQLADHIDKLQAQLLEELKHRVNC